MKSLTFAEFFALPPGAIFGQATGLPHQFSCGMYRKGESWSDDENDRGRAVQVAEIILDGLNHRRDGTTSHVVYEEDLDSDHRFLVYEPADLDRLASLIGRGPGWVEHREPTP